MIVVTDKDKKRNVMKLELSRKSKAVTEGCGEYLINPGFMGTSRRAE